MKAIDTELSVLEKHEVKTVWREKALWRRENRRWLRYSGHIALTVMHRLEELKMSQKELAEKMNCSPQYVSKLLKGSENLTLDTISKLEECLDLNLVRDSVRIVIDGIEQGILIAPPYQWETELAAGKHRIELEVCNAPGNRDVMAGLPAGLQS